MSKVESERVLTYLKVKVESVAVKVIFGFEESF